MSIPQRDIDAFAVLVAEHFSFLEADFNMHAVGVCAVNGGPRDSYIVAKYRQDDLRIDVAWNPFATALGVLLRIENSELERREQYVYLEPFIEFISNGGTEPIVPQIYPGMSLRSIEKVMQLRQELFAGGVEDSLPELGNRLKLHLADIRSCTAETVRDYQAWYQCRREAA